MQNEHDKLKKQFDFIMLMSKWYCIAMFICIPTIMISIAIALIYLIKTYCNI